jgi:predicted  nucleic acid-binding Zn-ribbon protein
MTSVKNIVELQKIDTQLMELEEILGDLPRKVEESIDEEKQLISNLKLNKDRIKEIKLELSKMESRVMDDNEKIDHLKDQLFKVTTNKQYDAIMIEIDHLKEQLDNDETVEIDFLEEKETLEKKIEEQEKSVESISNDLVEKRKKLEQLMQESAEQKKQLENDRNQLIKSIEPNVLKRYDLVRKARRGTAAVPVIGNSCSGCGAVVPPQKIAEIKEDKTPYTCDECSRFLYFENL